MLSFVVPIAHPANMRSQRRRGVLLQQTVNSLMQQEDRDFSVIVVGNRDVLAALPATERLHFVPVGFPPAGITARPRWEEVWNDKGAKIAVGVSYATRMGSTHVMSVDSDDLVSRRLASFVNQNIEGQGWFFPQGYLHISGSRSLIEVDTDFHLRCGTSHVVATNVHPVGRTIEPEMSREEIVGIVGQPAIRGLLGAHRGTRDFLAERGVQAEELPFSGSIWEIGTGENYTQMLSSSGRRVNLGASLASEFGLGVPSWPAHYTSAGRNLLRRVRRRVARKGDES